MGTDVPIEVLYIVLNCRQVIEYKPYTLLGPPVWRPVLAPLAVNSSTTDYIFLTNTTLCKNCITEANFDFQNPVDLNYIVSWLKL